MQDTMKHIHEAVEPAAGNPRFWGTITLRFRRQRTKTAKQISHLVRGTEEPAQTRTFQRSSECRENYV